MMNPVEMAIPNLKVVTLNVWGIHYISKDYKVRMNHLIDALSHSEYDIVALQEVWSYNDYLRIKFEIRHTYPYSHYFQSGLVGSGCCLFSKHYIQNVFYHKFSLNGYPHKVQHSDWFAGKLVGLAIIKYYRIKLNVYVTHLHANYSIESLMQNQNRQFSDEYLSHRLAQLFEMAQFISQTTESAQMSILLGDLNTCDYEVGYKMFRHHTNMLDAFKERQDATSGEVSGSTCHVKTNIYQTASDIRTAFPNGIRIDYILFNNKNDIDVKCLSCQNCFGKIEAANLNYSDHEGVCAEFELRRIDPNINFARAAAKNSIEPRIDYFLDVKAIIMHYIDSISFSQFFFVFIAILSLVLLFLFNDLDPYLTLVKNFFLTVLLFYSFIYVVFIKMIEKKQLKSTVDALDVLIDGYFINIKNNNNF